MSFGPDEAATTSGLAGYVARVLKGASSSGLPFQEAWKFEMAINLVTAKELGLMFPKAILARADIVVE